MKTLQVLALVYGMLLISITQIFGQTNLQFESVVQTAEKNIQLTWTSTAGELYQIQCANALLTNDDGSTAWQVLYDNYPSQGTNTFWLDTGNYNLAPQVVRPKDMPMRFYRILDKGADSLTDTPQVSIDVLTNNTTASGELTFTVTAATDQPGLHGTILYVDGQEMLAASDSTNYTIGATNYETDTYSINTCEWLNGTHILFATTEAASSFTSQVNSGPLLTAHAVSPFVFVQFNNLVQEIAFSQPSFDPASGQTQHVSAVFAANSDWTLNIVDVYTNVVQTASGSGMSMQYDWDGSGNGTNLPNGLYFYYITAQTNSGSPMSMSSSFSTSAASLVPEVAEPAELWALPPGSGNPVPFVLYPPGFDTNGFTLFEATPSEIISLKPSAQLATSFVASGTSISFEEDSGSGSAAALAPTPAYQLSPPTPVRPPSNPVRGLAGTIGVAGDAYTDNGTNGVTTPPLDNGLHIGQHIQMENLNAGATLAWPPLPETRTEIDTFVKTMQTYGWSNPLNKIDPGQLSINDLRGSGTPFNNVNLGILLLHGTYGNSPDYAANQCKQMYYVVASSATSAQYLRLSEMNLGGAGTNGLKWMVIDACHSLDSINWGNMKNQGVKPYNGNLHLLLGADSSTWTSPRKWYNFAKYINYGNQRSYSPLTIRAGYYQANIDAFKKTGLPPGTIITLAVAGDSACIDDTLQSNTPPSGSCNTLPHKFTHNDEKDSAGHFIAVNWFRRVRPKSALD